MKVFIFKVNLTEELQQAVPVSSLDKLILYKAQGQGKASVQGKL